MPYAKHAAYGGKEETAGDKADESTATALRLGRSAVKPIAHHARNINGSDAKHDVADRVTCAQLHLHVR